VKKLDEPSMCSHLGQRHKTTIGLQEFGTSFFQLLLGLSPNVNANHSSTIWYGLWTMYGYGLYLTHAYGEQRWRCTAEMSLKQIQWQRSEEEIRANKEQANPNWCFLSMCFFPSSSSSSSSV
jgi:hypothetical protein